MVKLKNGWPLVLAVGVFLADVWFFYGAVVAKTGGPWAYPLDDTYIHMALARNVAAHGTWGLSPEAFTSCSSAPLWTLLLAGAYWLMGVHELTPLLMASACGVGLLAAVFSILQRHQAPPRLILAALLAIIFFTPMPTLALVGLEHLLHALLTVLALDAGSRLLAWPPAPGVPRPRGLLLLLLLPFLVATRYEGLFLVAALVVLLLVRGRIWLAVGAAVGAATPVVVYGLISRAHGWFFLPNSIAVKKPYFGLSNLSQITGTLGGRAVEQLGRCPHLLSLLLALGLGLYLYRRATRTGFWEPLTVMTALLGAVAIMHLQCADVAWLFRYEAYLMAAGLAVLASLLAAPARKVDLEVISWPGLAAIGAIVLAIVQPALRGLDAQTNTPLAAKNIFQQQCQMARFVQKYGAGSPVALNDIGAVSFYSNTPCLDLWGLANMSTASARLANAYTPSVIADLAARNKTRVAIVYTGWFGPYGGLPRKWQAVEKWQIADNYVCGGNTVTFFATTPDAEEGLRRDLAEFSRTLPREVHRVVLPPAPKPGI